MNEPFEVWVGLDRGGHASFSTIHDTAEEALNCPSLLLEDGDMVLRYLSARLECGACGRFETIDCLHSGGNCCDDTPACMMFSLQPNSGA